MKDEIVLVKPSEISARETIDYREEHFANGEMHMHGSSLLGQAPSYEDWLEQVQRNVSEETVNPDWVISSTFFAVRRSDRRVIGMVDIRHTLNDFLREYGGHIGYGVRPSERRKGYGTQILEQALAYCALIGRERVMLACYSDNPASRKIIIKCGGKLEKTFVHTDGKTVEVYWITCEADEFTQEELEPVKRRHPKLLDKEIRPILFEQFEMTGEKMRIMEEFVLCHKCRADAVMIAPNRGIVGFEIKSDRDSLERLEHQVKEYSRFCDYNYIVTGIKHATKVMEIVPSFWGIYCVAEKEGQRMITCVREAILSPKVRVGNQLHFLWRSELIAIMKRHKIRGYSSRSKSKIRKLLMDTMEKEVLKLEMYEALMERDYSIYE